MTWASRYNFEVRLARRGFRMIGDGLFSRVYAKPGSNRVIKVGPVTDAWPLYVQWAKQHGYMGTFAPLVTSFRTFNPTSGYEFYVAVIERLAMDLKDARGDVAHFEEYRSLRNYFEDMDSLKTVPKDWTKFAKALKDYEKKNSAIRLDVHGGNFMLNATKDRLVLTDPFVDGRGKVENITKGTESTAKLFAKAREDRKLRRAIRLEL